MTIKVCKFGGSSLADANQFRKVKAIIQSDPGRRYVVPSAPGKRNRDDQKITDLLYLCHEHARQGLAFDEVFTLIADRYRGIVADLELNLNLDEPLATVREQIARSAKGPHAKADYAASRGEYLNGLIMAQWLGYAFIDAAEVIFFNRSGMLDEKKTYAALAQRLGEAQQAVIPGFYGSACNGSVKTFSRGGSDVTGAIVARGAKADVYENWTDVSGLLITDPRIVDKPQAIEIVTYRELRELAYMGATVLHDEAIFPVRDAGIPVNIRNTNAPDDKGTLILRRDKAQITSEITGIAGRRDFTIISIEKALMNQQLGYGRRLLEALESNAVSFEHMPTGIDTIGVVIQNSQLEDKLDKVLEDIRAACKPDNIEVDSNIALIATVGRGMAHHPGIAAKLFNALGQAKINIRLIDQGSSELNIIVGVAAQDFEPAVRAIYHAFVS